MNEAQAREEICRVGRSLFERGDVHATAGNVSPRLDDAAGGGYLITPTEGSRPSARVATALPASRGPCGGARLHGRSPRGRTAGCGKRRR